MSASQVGWGKTAGLAAGLFVLGAGAFWLEYKHKPASEERDEDAKKPLVIKDLAVKRLAMTVGTRTIDLVCLDLEKKLCKSGDSSKWEVRSPLKLKADDSNTNSMLSSINYLVPLEVLSLREDSAEKRASLLKQFGLDADSLAKPESARRIRVSTEKGETVLYLGEPHPLGESTYAAVERLASTDAQPSFKVDDERVYLVPNYFKASLDKDLNYWRDKKILSLSSSDVREFRLAGSESPDGLLSGKRGDGNTWTLSAKAQTFAGDAENIDSMLGGLAFLSAKEFVTEKKDSPEARKALQGSKVALELVLKHTGESKLTFSKVGTRILLTVSDLDPLYEVDAGGLDRFKKKLKDLRLSKLITSVERFSASRLRIEGKTYPTALEAELKDGKWTSKFEKFDGEKAQQLLDRISGNKVKDFLTPVPPGESAGIRVTLGDDKDPKKRELVLWRDKDRLLARDVKSSRSEAFLVDPTIRDLLPWEPKNLQLQ